MLLLLCYNLIVADLLHYVNNNFVKGGVILTANQDIRTAAKQNGVFLWEIAEKLNVMDSNFSRKLRRELPADEKQRIISLIDEISAEKKNAVWGVDAPQAAKAENRTKKNSSAVIIPHFKSCKQANIAIYQLIYALIA